MAEEGIKAQDLPIVNSIENNSYLMAITDMTENNQVKNISKYNFIGDIISSDGGNQLIQGIDGKLLVINNGVINGEPTGFLNKDEVFTNYNPATRTVTISGNVQAYNKGFLVPELVNGWTSPAHPDVEGTYFLYYNVDTKQIVFNTIQWDYRHILIAIVEYHPEYSFDIKETHGLSQDHDTHRNIHEQIGTYKTAGSDLSDYTIDDVDDKRPNVSVTTLRDEDLTTENAPLNTKQYTHFYLSDENSKNFTIDNDDIVPLDGDIPYYNEFDGTDWVQTAMTNDTYQSIFLLAIPTGINENSQKYRYIWVQGQSIQDTIEQARLIDTRNVNLGMDRNITSEFVFVKQVIIHYVDSNWSITEIIDITGNRVSQVQVAGATTGLTVVNSDATLTGDGTAGNPLGVNLNEIAASPLTPFALNSGYTDSNGDPDLLSYSTGTLSFKVDDGTAYAPLVATPANSQPTFTRTSIPDLDVSGYDDGTYNIFAGAAGSAVAYANTIYRQSSAPTSAIWTQPVLAANGTMGGAAAAAAASDVHGGYDGQPWRAFNKQGVDSPGWVTNTGVAPPYWITFYNPAAFVLTDFDIINRSHAWTAFTLQGSNDNSSWVDIQSYTNDNTTENNTWNKTVGVQNRGLYKYHRFYITSTTSNTSADVKQIELYGKPLLVRTDDIWLDTSVEPLKAYKYSGSVWEEFNLVPIGSATVASGVITGVGNVPFNQNGYNANILTSAPDYSLYISKSTSGFIANADGYLRCYITGWTSGSANVKVNGNYVASIDSSTTGFSVTVRISKGDVITTTTTGSGQINLLHFYPMKGAI